MQTYWLMDSDRKEKKEGGKKEPWAQTMSDKKFENYNQHL